MLTPRGRFRKDDYSAAQKGYIVLITTLSLLSLRHNYIYVDEAMGIDHEKEVLSYRVGKNFEKTGVLQILHEENHHQQPLTPKEGSSPGWLFQRPLLWKQLCSFSFTQVYYFLNQQQQKTNKKMYVRTGILLLVSGYFRKSSKFSVLIFQTSSTSLHSIVNFNRMCDWSFGLCPMFSVPKFTAWVKSQSYKSQLDNGLNDQAIKLLMSFNPQTLKVTERHSNLSSVTPLLSVTQ